MALFDENVTVMPAPRNKRTRAGVAGIWALVAALVVLLVISFLPTGYVIQRPGPVFDTLGTAASADGSAVPLISIGGAATYPTAGTLDMLTVQVVGNRERTPSWFDLTQAWFDPSKAVLPIDEVFPQGQSSEQRNDENTAMMVDSQKEATAAALTHLGYDVKQKLTVYALTNGSAAEGILEKGDVISAANGTPVTDADTLRQVINDAEGKAVSLDIVRAGTPMTVSVTPKQVERNGTTVWMVGVQLLNDFDFPIQVTIQLDNVGGPSAGMMFALGIIDKLTPGQLNGGARVAGTGTITADGQVGPIGGIRQKMWGAVDAGAVDFLAPATNCDEVVGHVPNGLRVFAVKTLDDSLAALEKIRSKGDLDSLPTCESVQGAAPVR